jgi:hypothetical protein
MAFEEVFGNKNVVDIPEKKKYNSHVTQLLDLSLDQNPTTRKKKFKRRNNTARNNVETQEYFITLFYVLFCIFSHSHRHNMIYAVIFEFQIQKTQENLEKVVKVNEHRAVLALNIYKLCF